MPSRTCVRRSAPFGAAMVVGVMTLAGGAQAITVIDDLVLSRGHNVGVAVGSGTFKNWHDNIGNTDVWETKRIVVDRDLVAGVLKFDIYTNKSSDSEGGVLYADLAIDLSPDDAFSGPFNSWDLGINFQLKAGDAGNVRRLYSIASNGTWQTSTEAHGLSNPNTIYGGRFRHSECGTVDASANPLCLDALDAGFEAVVNIPVGAAGVVDLGTVSYSLVALIGDITSHRIHLEISGATLLASGIGNRGFDIFWGTGQCGNDAIWGSVPASEPGSLALFGLGLLGLGWQRHRRRVRA